MPKELSADEAKDVEQFFYNELAPPKRVIGKPFEKGQSGNPAGKPQEAEGLDANLDLVIGRAGARKLAKALVDIALNGSGHVQFAALQYIFDRREGRPRQQQPTNSQDEDPLVRILRSIVDDRRPLQGRTFTALRPGPVIEGEVREYPSEGAGP